MPATCKCLINYSYCSMETTYRYNLWFILWAPYKSTNLFVCWLLISPHCTPVDIMLSNQDKGSFRVYSPPCNFPAASSLSHCVLTLYDWVPFCHHWNCGSLISPRTIFTL